MAININEIANNGIDDDNNGVVDDVYGASFFGFSEGVPPSSPMDLHSHGTHIASLVAAESNNNEGIVGINQQVSLIGVRFLDADGAGTQADASAAIYYAVQRGADVINCSWGYFKANTILKDAIQYAIDSGVVVVAAVGNTATNVKEYPASLPEVICVGSMETNLKLSSFSSFGTQLDFLVYGRNIYGAILDGHYGYKTGTSQSAGIITGLVSIVLSQNNQLSLNDIVLKLQYAAANGTNRQSQTGFGAIQAPSFLESMSLTSNDIYSTTDIISSTGDFTLDNVYNFPNPIISNSTTFGFETTEAGAAVTVSIFDLDGNQITTLQDTSVDGYNSISWDLDNQPNGTYLYHVKLDNGETTEIALQKLAIIR